MANILSDISDNSIRLMSGTHSLASAVVMYSFILLSYVALYPLRSGSESFLFVVSFSLSVHQWNPGPYL